jgi:hypothetical protein
VLADFARFWEIEASPPERRKLIASLFERVWAHDRAIVAVKPRAPFASYFRAAKQAVPKAGATGLEPATSGVTGRRSNRLSYAPKGPPV